MKKILSTLFLAGIVAFIAGCDDASKKAENSTHQTEDSASQMKTDTEQKNSEMTDTDNKKEKPQGMKDNATGGERGSVDKSRETQGNINHSTHDAVSQTPSSKTADVKDNVTKSLNDAADKVAAKAGEVQQQATDKINQFADEIKSKTKEIK